MPLKFVSDEGDLIRCKCSICGKMHDKSKDQLKFISTRTYEINGNGLHCDCGSSYHTQIAWGNPIVQGLSATSETNTYTELKCPKCKSTNLTANTKGFGLGKAAVGGILLGPVGLLGGLYGILFELWQSISKVKGIIHEKES